MTLHVKLPPLMKTLTFERQENNHKLNVEDSSYIISKTNCFTFLLQGCWNAILEYANDKAIYVIAIGVAIGVVEVLMLQDVFRLNDC